MNIRRFIRVEEVLLGFLIAVGTALCLRSGTGFDFWPVFWTYVDEFDNFILIMVAASWGLRLIETRWEPKHPRLVRVRRWLLGSSEGSTPALWADLEFLRGVMLLFVSLTVYTNVKVRIPHLNASLADPLLLAADHAVLGARFALWLESTVAGSPMLIRFFERVYLHDYFFMVVLVAVFYLRRQAFFLRWAFSSVCATYLVGILFTAAYPSVGPFLLEPERFTWLQGTRIGLAQQFLRDSLLAGQQAVASGAPIVARAFAGIAAFPSLHIGHMVVLTAVARRGFPRYVPLMVTMTVLTFVPTVAFGWHYSVDAIGGLLLAFGVAEFLYSAIRWWAPATLAVATEPVAISPGGAS